MKIALRTSGGRGEYELAGRQGGTRASDVFDRAIEYELAPGLVVPGNVEAKWVQGKPRLRLVPGSGAVHFYRLLASALLLPVPIRELRRTPEGSLVLRDGTYCVSSVRVDVAQLHSRRVRLRPTKVLFANRSKSTRRVDFAERMSEIACLWRAAEEDDSALGKLVRSHRDALLNAPENHRQVERIAQEIRKASHLSGYDLEVLAAQLGVELPAPQDFEEPEEPEVNFDEAQLEDEEDETTTFEGTRLQIRKWRRQAIRGSDARRFRTEVKRAYDHTCVFSGVRLPRTEITTSPGVDAAHILPWATHNINRTTNGLCLSKLCHWAFDEGLLTLSYEPRDREYLIELPEVVRNHALHAGLDLAPFASLVGPVPRDRLPRNPRVWPSPRALGEYNTRMFA